MIISPSRLKRVDHEGVPKTALAAFVSRVSHPICSGSRGSVRRLRKIDDSNPCTDEAPTLWSFAAVPEGPPIGFCSRNERSTGTSFVKHGLLALIVNKASQWMFKLTLISSSYEW